MIYEIIITKGEISKQITPKELIEWVELMMETINVETLRMRKGLAKQLVEEVYPLAVFAFKKYGETNEVHIKPMIGSQNYDAIIFDDSYSPALVRYVEVTQSHEGETEYLRALYLQEHGYVPLTGKVKKEGTKKTGLRIEAELKAVPVIENAYSEL